MHIKIAFYLDVLTGETGSLRVIPGSHLIDDVYAATVTEMVGGMDGPSVPAVALETVPGDSERTTVCSGRRFRGRLTRCPLLLLGSRRLQPQLQARQLRRRRPTPNVHGATDRLRTRPFSLRACSDRWLCVQMNLCQTYPAGKEAQLQQYLEGIARFLVDRPYSEINIATVRRPFPAPL